MTRLAIASLLVCSVAWSQPRRFLQSVNRLFYENTADSAYATLFFAEYDGRGRRLRFVKTTCNGWPAT